MNTTQKVSSFNEQKMRYHSLAKNNLEQFGTIKIGSEPTKDFVFLTATQRGENYNNLYSIVIELVCDKDVKEKIEFGADYKSKSYAGIYTKINKSFEIVSCNHTMNPQDKQKLANYIRNNFQGNLK